MNSKKTALVTSSIAVITILVYLNFALSLVSFPDIVTLLLAFLLGPAIIWGMTELYENLAPLYSGKALKLGTLFLVIAFSFFTLMIVVQQSIFIGLADTEMDASLKQSILILGNLIQLGMDVTFDVFYCLGLTFIAFVLLILGGSARWFGISGIIISVMLLLFNIATFPNPPSESGLIDIGPLSGLWWLSFILVGLKKNKTGDGGS